eukprot:TRINITY_DN24013_c0_g1_i1.p1 TRINITY_DN24013_c0_g1~~TRINITY_DN24013_c0_g1_i1.p1  ORF type:complete len:145 (+),score=18.69 TRINITY_DN24013_c0_g1_i1:27-437(+)
MAVKVDAGFLGTVFFLLGTLFLLIGALATTGAGVSLLFLRGLPAGCGLVASVVYLEPFYNNFPFFYNYGGRSIISLYFGVLAWIFFSATSDALSVIQAVLLTLAFILSIAAKFTGAADVNRTILGATGSGATGEGK